MHSVYSTIINFHWNSIQDSRFQAYPTLQFKIKEIWNWLPRIEHQIQLRIPGSDLIPICTIKKIHRARECVRYLYKIQHNIIDKIGGPFLIVAQNTHPRSYLKNIYAMYINNIPWKIHIILITVVLDMKDGEGCKCVVVGTDMRLGLTAVSYTHLDVYKRQEPYSSMYVSDTKGLMSLLLDYNSLKSIAYREICV